MLDMLSPCDTCFTLHPMFMTGQLFVNRDWEARAIPYACVQMGIGDFFVDFTFHFRLNMINCLEVYLAFLITVVGRKSIAL